MRGGRGEGAEGDHLVFTLKAQPGFGQTPRQLSALTGNQPGIEGDKNRRQDQRKPQPRHIKRLKAEDRGPGQGEMIKRQHRGHHHGQHHQRCRFLLTQNRCRNRHRGQQHHREHLADGKTNSKQYQHFIDDIRQLKEETERCRAILAELNDDAVLLGNESTDPVTISAFLKSLMEERFADIATMLSMEVNANEAIAEPMVTRRPELIHPIETLVDNAAHFTETSIGLGLSWDEMNFTITIRDDGPGFQSSVLASLGDPYASSREGVDGHMGLGVFIAMTMVNHVGGSIKIGNRKTGGAEAILTYPREGFDAGP
mgnify:CR=1 FL=1